MLSNSTQGMVTLKIGNAVVQASTNLPLYKNAHLLLEVVQQQPRLLLRLVPVSGDHAATRQLQQALIGFLPRQTGLAPSLAGLIQKSLQHGNLPAETRLRPALVALGSAVPQRSNLFSPDGVRYATMHSGLFLEALLARATSRSRPDTSRDLKACLLRLQGGLERYLDDAGMDLRLLDNTVPRLYNAVGPPRQGGLPMPQARAPVDSSPQDTDVDRMISDLLMRTMGAAARLGMHQVLSARNFQDGVSLWQLELPVKYGHTVEVVSLTIEQEQQGSRPDGNNVWSVNLALDLPSLGPVRIRITRFDQGVSASFWTDSDGARSVIERQFDSLHDRLHKLGVSTLSLCCQTGSPDAGEPADRASSNIDLQA